MRISTAAAAATTAIILSSLPVWAAKRPVVHSTPSKAAAPATRPAVPDADMTDVDGVPFTVIASDNRWTCYSSAPNQMITGYAVDSVGQTWLATEGGIKQLSADGALIHFHTTIDGLPSADIRAVCASAKHVWCIAYEWDGQAGRYCFCSLDAASGKWQTIKTLDDNSGGGMRFHPWSAIVQPSAGAVWFMTEQDINAHAIVASRYDIDAKTFADLTMGDSILASAPKRAYLQPQTTFATVSADGGSLFIGSSLGLARYDSSSGAWTMTLAHAILGGCDDHAGGVWLTGPEPLSGSESMMSRHIVHMSLSDGRVLLDEAAPMDGMFFGRPFEPVAMTTAEDGSVWTAPASAPYRARNLSTTVVRFGPDISAWSVCSANSLADPAFPAAAAKLAATACQVDAGVLSKRLKGWFGESARAPQDICAAVAAGPDSVRTCWDADGGAWRTAGRGSLEHVDAKGKSIAAYPLPSTLIAAHPAVGALAAAGDTLYMLSAGKLYSWTSSSTKWREHDLPDYFASRENDAQESLVPIDGSLWVQSMRSIAIYDPASDTFRKLPISPDGPGVPTIDGAPGQYLGDDDGCLWFGRGMFGGQLVAAPAGFQRLDLVQPEFSSPRSNSNYRFLAVAGGKLLCLKLGGSPNETSAPVTAWDFKTRKTVDVGTLENAYGEAQVFVTPTAIYVAPRQFRRRGVNAGAVYRYALATGEWSKYAAPPATENRGDGNVGVALYVDDTGAFFFNGQTHLVWRWSPSSNQWSHSSTAAPLNFAPNEEVFSPARTARIGDAIYIGTRQGLWQYEIAKDRVTRMDIDMPVSKCLTAIPRSATPSAVWASCIGPIDGSAVGRLNRANGTWKLWFNTRDSAGSDATAIADDGRSAVAANMLSQVLLLNPSTDRWDDKTSVASQPFLVHFGDSPVLGWHMAADSAGIWLRASTTTANYAPNGTPVGPPALVEWNSETQRFAGYAPNADAGHLEPGCAEMALMAGSVWLPVADGLWEFKKSSSSWVFHAPPAGAPNLRDGQVNAIKTGSDGALWMVGFKAVYRYRP